MKKLILIVAFLLILAPVSYSQCLMSGKVASDTYQTVTEADYVIAETSNGVYLTPIEMSGYVLDIPCNIDVKVGLISTRRYYWDTVRVNIPDGGYVWWDFIAVRKTTTSRKR